MATSLETESELRRRYLLGELSELEEASLEERYFANDEAFEQLLATEDELVDEYVRGALSSRQRQRLEARLKLSVDGRRKLEFSRALMRVRDPARAPENSSPSWSRRGVSFSTRAVVPATLAAAILVLTIIGVWMLVERERARLREPTAARQAQPEPPRPQVADSLPSPRQSTEAAPTPGQTADSVPAPKQTSDTALAPQQTAENARPPAQPTAPVQEPGPAKPSKTSSVLLVASIRGSGTVNRLVIGPDTDSAELRIPLEDDGYRNYRALIRKLDGKVIWRAAPLKPARVGAGKVLTARVPAKALAARELTVMVEGAAGSGRFEDVAEFYLEVVRK